MIARFRVTLFVLVIAIAAGIVIRTHRFVTRQREQLATLGGKAEQLEKQIAAEQRSRAATGRDLDLARAQLAELPPPPDAASRAREADIRAWLTRVARLQELFKERPDQAIPEMRLLTGADWLQAARKASLGTDEDERRALAAVRASAKSKFINQISSAVGKYMRATNGEQPPVLAALLPYFNEPPDPAILQRYELTAFNPPNRPRATPPGLTVVNATATWAVREAMPVDADYDSRVETSSTRSTSMMGAPLAWIPNFRERVTAAYTSFSEANHGASPPSFADAAPYFNPPLPAGTVEKVEKAERERNK